MLGSFFGRYGHFFGAAALLAALSIPFVKICNSEPPATKSPPVQQTDVGITNVKIAMLETEVKRLNSEILELKEDRNQIYIRFNKEFDRVEADVTEIRLQIVKNNDETKRGLDDMGKNLTARVERVFTLAEQVNQMLREFIRTSTSKPTESRPEKK